MKTRKVVIGFLKNICLGLLLMGGLSSCDLEESSGSSDAICFSGETQVCDCLANGEIVQGVQACAFQGLSWTQCDCGILSQSDLDSSSESGPTNGNEILGPNQESEAPCEECKEDQPAPVGPECPPNAVCTCEDGYQGDGVDCTDIDECATGISSCDINADCENTIGAYLCACKPGFVGDGYYCSDSDECLNGAADCPEGQECINTTGGYECVVPPCGNGVIDFGEECDDGNTEENDGCSALCTVEFDPGCEELEVYSGNGFSYCLVLDGKNWHEAEEHCVAWSGHMVSIHSAQEQAFVDELAAILLEIEPAFGNSNGGHFWIGLTDAGHEADWQWTDGTPLAFTNWNSCANEPNHNGIPGQEDFAVQYINKLDEGCPEWKWGDNSPGNERPFICKKPPK